MQVSGCYPLGCSSFSRTLPPPSLNQRCLCRRVRGLQTVSEGGILWTSKPGASPCYGELKIPPTPCLKVCRLGHGERRRKAREEIAVILAIGHTLRAHEALSRPDALPASLRTRINESPKTPLHT
jgi:hypothetical protein